MALESTVTEFFAAENVAGSQLLLDLGIAGRVLIDMGLRYKEGEWDEPLPFDPASVDHVIFTHGHADHMGQSLRLTDNGFAGDATSTYLTADIIKMQLRQAVSSPFIFNKWAKGKRFEYGPRKGEWIPFKKPLHTSKDITSFMERFRQTDGKPGAPYRTPVQLNDRLRVTFYDAGHIPGSAQALLEATNEQGKTTKILAAYDLGRTDYQIANHPVAEVPIVRFPDKDLPKDIDYYITEATYGDKEHKNLDDSLKILEDCINHTHRTGGKLITPAFSIMRTHMLWSFNYRFHKEGLVPDDMTLHSSSPGAFEMASLFVKYLNDYDEQAQEAFKNPEDNDFYNRWIRHHQKMDETLDLLAKPGPYWINASSGMGDKGRIVTVLRHTLPDSKAIILRTGYAAAGTPMRLLGEGAKEITIDPYSPPIKVRASFQSMGGLSGHADYKEIIEHMKQLHDPTKGEQFKGVYIKHGEKQACHDLRQKIIEAGYDANKVHVLQKNTPLDINLQT